MHLPKCTLLLIFGVSASLGISPKFLPCDDEKNATIVRCSGRKLKHVPLITSDRVIAYDLSFNKLRHLTKRTFAGVPNLEKLNLSNNCQPTNLRPDKGKCWVIIDPDALIGLKHLEDLDLSGNSLTTIPPLPENIKHLNLNLNNIDTLSERDFAGLTILTLLDVGWNCYYRNTCAREFSITEGALRDVTSLEILVLSFNNISSFPRNLPSSLTELYLAENKIWKIDKEDLCHLTKLQKLDVQWNCARCDHAAQPCFPCQNDSALQLRPGAFDCLTNLSDLNLRGNSLPTVNSSLFDKLSCLTRLDLSDNLLDLAKETFFSKLKKVQILDVDFNFRTDRMYEKLVINPSAASMKSLKKISLVGYFFNILDSNSIQSLLTLPNLKEIYLRTNFILQTNLSMLLLNKNIRRVDLAGNLISFQQSCEKKKNEFSPYFFSQQKKKREDYIAGWVDFQHDIKEQREDYFDGWVDLQHDIKEQRDYFDGWVDLQHDIKEQREDYFDGWVDLQHDIKEQHEDYFDGWVDLQHDTKKHEDTTKESPNCWHYKRSVDLSFNNLMALSSDDFVGMEDVECLNMSYNYINKRLDGNQFGHLKSLRHLDLSYNRFDLYYYLAFSELPNLRVLNLAHNEYQFMLKGVNHNLNFLENLTNLIELNLNHNMIGLRITEELKNPSLERLFFRHNELMNVWEYGKQTYITLFTNFTRLKLLDISYNKLAVIPVKVLERFPLSLETLIISHNNLYSFHWEKITYLVNLTHLDLSHNSLKSLHSNMTTIRSKLTYLNLKLNKITSVNKEFFELFLELKSLYLGGNRIQTIDVNSFPKKLLQTLQYLDVQKNPFDCTCHTSWFTHFLMETKITVPGLATKMRCDSPDSMRGKLLLSMNLESCQDLYGRKLFLCSTFLVISWLLVTLTLKLFSWDLWYLSQVLLASIRCYSKLPGQSTEEYDAFVVFNTKDEAITDWVYHELLVQLEGHEMGSFNLCLEDRDWLAGKSSIENLYDAIYKSKRTIFILDCEGFSTGVLCHAFLMSHQRLLDEKKDVLVLVILDHRMRMSPYLLTRKRICPKTFMTWPRNVKAHGYFWHRLRVLLRQDSQHYYDPRLQKQLNQ
ncbi:toll-like receptor 9 [Rana temporaria]|uniref:toll-like receptor 9 n=1 Tax=Rana temporaria TaxID=8407 RepID=UPI001AADB762|nr:toll-like receptor 9 [Rana temporaria]